MNSNRTKISFRYLAYALGEIFLIVIGILIALQISNWNANKKLQKQKIDYLQRLLIDLEFDLNGMDYVQSQIEENQQIISTFIKALESPEKENELFQSVDDFLEKGWIINEFVPNDNTYTDLSQTGNMKVLNNSDLVNLILEYYGYLEQLVNSNDINKNWITPLDQDLAKETPVFRIAPNTSILFSNTDKKKEIQKLLKDKDLIERNAAGHFWINQTLHGNIEAIKQLTIDLEKEIEAELELLI